MKEGNTSPYWQGLDQSDVKSRILTRKKIEWILKVKIFLKQIKTFSKDFQISL